jgi:hypothetical protein
MIQSCDIMKQGVLSTNNSAAVHRSGANRRKT